MQHQKNGNERYSTRNGYVKSGSLMNNRISKRLSSKTESVLRSNTYCLEYRTFAHLHHLTLISNPLRLYAILKLANSKNFRKVHSVLSNVTYCYKRSIFLHFTLCKIRISKSTSSFPDRKYQYLVKFCRLFISFCKVRGAEN